MTHDEISQFLETLVGADGAAGYQGSLFGHASASPPTALSAWPEQVLGDLPEPERSSETVRLLRAAAHYWVAALEDGELSIRLLLPRDDAPLAERTDAMCQWCQGFLFGLASAGVTKFDDLPGHVPEFVKDVVGISQATADSEDEGDEVAYTELVEYLRVGTQLIHDELAALAPAPTVQ